MERTVDFKICPDKKSFPEPIFPLTNLEFCDGVVMFDPIKPNSESSGGRKAAGLIQSKMAEMPMDGSAVRRTF